jgi:DNA-binding NarL/FixJ family response regulator
MPVIPFVETRSTAAMASSRRKPTVVLADDHGRVLSEATMLLRDEFEVVATVGDGAKAVQAVTELRPDVVVLDIGMPGTDGIQAALRLKALGVTPKLVFLTVQLDADTVEAACAMGACYVLKARMYSDLSTAIEEALAGRLFFSKPLHSHGSPKSI